MDDQFRRSAPPGIHEALRAVGCEHGQNAAAWWIQDTIGSRAAGDARTVASRVLQGIDDGDPAVLDALPSPQPRELPGDAHWWADLRLAYTDGFQHGCHHAIGAACQTLLA